MTCKHDKEHPEVPGWSRVKVRRGNQIVLDECFLCLREEREALTKRVEALEKLQSEPSCANCEVLLEPDDVADLCVDCVGID